ncbi:MAG: hypothetical protein GX859_02425, partial [Corynebacterium humireducens]|nr:hypothetical protein [Corynebacterium humireducens]
MEIAQTIRLTVISREEARVSTTPLTAFVRPNEDATVDLTTAASDPAGDVLLLGDLEVEPLGNASLDVDIIGQRYLRVSGETEDGTPGTLGTARYRVSDGSGVGNREAWGEVTLVLLPASEAIAPIAAPDTATVRAGELIDIPVLANDTSPAGAQLHIDPSTVVNEHDAGLAFATSTQLRYLAPEEPGTYTVTYGVFLLGYPTLTSTSTVTITVTGREGNVAPTAPTLEGRVQSGNTVSIPFDPFDTDVDGDVPVLDRIIGQPEAGSASITPEGDAIMFVSEPGFQGQVRFNYRLRDNRGETATGEVRVGVLDQQADPSPITYSDYVQVQQGDDNRIAITPLDNDIDPSGTELTLTSVIPNATEGTREYDALRDRIYEVDLVSGRIVILGSDELGTSSFIYTVTNERGDTAMGLVVVKVVREHVPSHPRIQDTVLTHETLSQLEGGVDVITDHVSWNAGDPSNLTMQLWRNEPGFTAEGHTITGTPPRTARIVPFEVSGGTFTGETMTSYGFLRIPGEETHTLSLKTAYRELEVSEHGSIDVDLTQAITIPAGHTLETIPAHTAPSGQREAATCVVQGTIL